MNTVFYVEYKAANASEWSSNQIGPYGFNDGCDDVYTAYLPVSVENDDSDYDDTAYADWERTAADIARTLQDGEQREFTVHGITWNIRLA